MHSIQRILQVHNFYKQRGGEANVVEREKELLENNGHIVNTFYKYSKDSKGLWAEFNVALNMPYSKTVYKEFSDVLDKHKPDVVHVHNTFPLITPSIFYACSNKKIPVVYTLHNYRLIYPNALLMHDGKIDERVLEGSAYSILKDKVYQNSFLKSAAITRLIEVNKKKKTWNTQVNKFICLTNFAKDIFSKWGITNEKIVVKPNFVDDPFEIYPQLEKSNKPEGFLFVGRISKEKGVEDLVDTWIKFKLQIPLYIVGDGDLKSMLMKKSKDNKHINWVGLQNKEQVFEWLAKVKALIFPSIWYEGFPMTLAESMAVGVPVICSNIGSQESIIKHEVSGLHFKVSDLEDLRKQVMIVDSDSALVEKLSTGARNIYLKNYTSLINYHKLIDIYNSVII